MLRALGLVSALSLFVACGVGSDPDPGPGPSTDDVDERIQCTAELTMTGTFTAAATLDPTMGCQPSGTWNVTVTVSDMGECSSVPLKASYVYTVVGTGPNSTISYEGTGDETLLQISAGGDGSCQGSFEHIFPASGGNFHQLEMGPTIPEPATATTTLTIGGTGTYNLWKERP